ncbi:sensor histidine kinase [Actinoplanes awajinensis]|uniref:histidine kinase n=1 Tax=Actinoplanes awajinensis subsp. mycoplanecinus TaxID=135947 RepID=A0A0X3VDC5_9ACTN|nr:sensor histidine kinase [Actinoplanes awajinensis]KUL41316.1 hypothetical protein ADL15_03405 [Actinoplanes awajinensis subsp. mycoplanecinus]
MRGTKRLLYALVGLPLGLFGLAYVAVTIVAGSALALTVVGLPLLAAAVRGARLLGTLHHALAQRLLEMTAAGPVAPAAGTGFLDWVTIGLTDRAGWQAAVYLLIKAPIAVLTAAIALFFYGYGLAAATYPAWWRLIPPQEGHEGLQLPGDVFLDTWSRALMVAVVGAAMLLAAPRVLRTVLVLDRVAIAGLLGPGKLRERVRELERSRAFAVQDAAAALRRIERDLHDGTQARLVTLAMKIGAAKEHLAQTDADPAARDLVSQAHQEAKAALVELRDVARGIHPPILDSGLDTALSTLAARSPIPVELTGALTRQPSAEVRLIAYFCVAELLTNVVKHSGARCATLDVEHRGDLLRLTVTDNGTGGARPRSGLIGLADRVRTVDGRLDVDSPDGGPTVVTVELPCGS